MLANILAIAVALGSFVLFMAAFFFPEVHRKSDFLWSGVAMFYALVLWICAGRITGGVLLGQTASVALLGWLGWETLRLRRATTATEGQTLISPETREKINRLSPNTLLAPITNRFRKAKPPTAAPVESVATLVEEAEPQNLETLADRVVSPPPTAESSSETAVESEASAIAQSIAPPPETPLETPPEEEETETLEVATLTVEQITSVETGEVLSETVELAVETLEVNIEDAPSGAEVEASDSFIPLEEESELKVDDAPSASEVEASDSFIPLEEKTEVNIEVPPVSEVETSDNSIPLEEKTEVNIEVPLASEVETSDNSIPLEPEGDLSPEIASETSQTEDNPREGEQTEEPSVPPQANPPKPPTSEMVEAAKESKKNGNSEPTPVQEFAPEIDLAPYADPHDRE